MHFYYDRLKSIEEKQVYQLLKNAVENHQDSIRVDGFFSGTRLKLIYTYLLLDYPDFFWTKGDFRLDQRRTDKDPEQKMYLSYLCDEDESCARDKRIQESLEEICDAIEDDSTIENIVRNVFMWFQKNVSYHAVPGEDQTIYSALVMRKSVCKGIAKAVNLVLRLYDIDSIVVSGMLLHEHCHAWNMVCLDGIWYHLDIAIGYSCFDEVRNKYGIPGSNPPVLIRKEDLPAIYDLSDEIRYLW